MMKIVMTLMVRDEADIVGAMLEHHFAQGVDHIIATDNASVDGTREILESFAARGLLTLHHDPRHEKQQASVVTGMAREAATVHGATWVLNADADEFWVAENPNRSLREALSGIPTAYKAFNVPVIDMTGEPALEGSGISRLIYRDLRPLERINALGLHAHATHDVAFVADPDVEVAQGNHFVNIESMGQPEPGQGIEVLHLPWRSWKQFSTKVRNAGEAYERSGLTPSPNHHGMRDYRRLLEDRLLPLYLARHPREEEVRSAGSEDLKRDERLAESLVDPVGSIPFDDTEWAYASKVALPFVRLEEQLAELREARDAEHRWAEHLNSELSLRENEAAELRSQLESYRSRLAVRSVDSLRKFFTRNR